jgi:hypothetical protein
MREESGGESVQRHIPEPRTRINQLGTALIVHIADRRRLYLFKALTAQNIDRYCVHSSH